MERAWMAEKDRILREMDVAKQQANVGLRESVMNLSLSQPRVDPEEVRVGFKKK